LARYRSHRPGARIAAGTPALPVTEIAMRVKVCGITNDADAEMAVGCGVDALGFNFFPRSPRYIRPEDAGRIIRRLPPFIATVGLFVNVARSREVSDTARLAGVQAIQLHGDETPAFCRELADWPLIKALRIGANGISEKIEEYEVKGFLLDAKDDALFGGTGRSFDWCLAKNIQRTRPIILAGGLRPDNVREAIRIVSPYAVDVCSGVESAPGKKDPGKLREFMNEVRNASYSDDRA
jgi:phosphoribosylanthranilate isomerase